MMMHMVLFNLLLLIIFTESKKYQIKNDGGIRSLLNTPQGFNGALHHVQSLYIFEGDTVCCQNTGICGIVRKQHPNRTDDNDNRWTLQRCGKNNNDICDYSSKKLLANCSLDEITLCNKETDGSPVYIYDPCGNPKGEGSDNCVTDVILSISDEEINSRKIPCSCQQCLSEDAVTNVFAPIPYGSNASFDVPSESRSGRGQKNFIDIAKKFVTEIKDECQIVIGIMSPNNSDIEYFNQAFYEFDDIYKLVPDKNKNDQCSHLLGQSVTRIGAELADNRCDSGKKCVASIIIDKTKLKYDENSNIEELYEEQEFNFERAGCYANGCSNTVIIISDNEDADTEPFEDIKINLDAIRNYKGNSQDGLKLDLFNPESRDKKTPTTNYKQRNGCYRTYQDSDNNNGDYLNIDWARYAAAYGNAEYCFGNDADYALCIEQFEELSGITTNSDNYANDLETMVDVLDKCYNQ